jgi:hypothetical protein
MNAEQILEKVAERYATCRSYVDGGWVQSDDQRHEPIVLNFKTFFSRPHYLRFDWQHYCPRRGKTEALSSLRHDGEKCWFLWKRSDETTLEERSTLSLTIAGASGCSCGAAFIVPSLLLPDIAHNGRQVLNLSQPQFIGLEKIIDAECFVVSGSSSKPNDQRLWIDCRDFSLRKLFVDSSWTAEDSKQHYEQITSDQQQLERLTSLGIAPPPNMQFTAGTLLHTYFYRSHSLMSRYRSKCSARLAWSKHNFPYKTL